MKTKPTKDKEAKPQLRWATKSTKTGQITSFCKSSKATKLYAMSVCVPGETVVRVEIREVTK